MFGGTKPSAFGTPTANTGFGGFNTSGTTFGQSAFGKPATSTFGAAPAFGTQQPPSLFGSAAGQAQQSNLFGGAGTSTAFGAAAPTQTAFGGFSQPQQNTSIFGAAQPAANNSLFGQAATSAFGSAVKPATLSGFGQPQQQPTSSLFGQNAPATSTGGFGAFSQTPATSNSMFGSGTASAFGQTTAANAANAGTSIAKFTPTIGTDTLVKGGQPNNVSTKNHCITAMKEYENKSLEELRFEDYSSNRKGPQAGATAGGGFFGAGTQPAAPNAGLFGTNTQQQPSLFGQQQQQAATENKGLFGGSSFGQTGPSAFGATQQQNNFLGKPFGATTTTGFGATTTDAASNPFGTKQAFGQTAAPSLFGQPQAANPATSFGQPSTGFGSFAAPAATQQPSLFGAQTADANKPAFGLGATSSAPSAFSNFGQAATSTAGGLFGSKPATGFGAAPAFGATSTANAPFGNFSLNNTNTTGGGLFGSNLNKPATTGFGAFNTQTSTAPLNFNTGGGSVFGNNAAKPGGMFSNTMGGNPNTGGGMFGNNTSAFGTGNTLGGSFGAGSFANNTLSGLPGTAQPATVSIHQQILSKVSSPYGDNPLFKDLKRNDETDATRATNPAAQKAILDSTNNQFSIAFKPTPSVVKVKPFISTSTKKSLFEGLEDYDASFETFTLKPNCKRLILKPKVNDTGNNHDQASPVVPLVSNTLTAVTSKPQAAFVDSAQEPIRIASVNDAQSPASAKDKENDASRRESWLHPNNLQKVRQQNVNSAADSSPLNTTVSELVPRKPLDTYKSLGGGRHSVSTVPENPFEDDANTGTPRRLNVTFSSPNESLNFSTAAGRDDHSIIEDGQATYEEHPTGITLRRLGYYTIPTLDELKSYLAEDGTCIVPNFTIGREGYGNVYFPKELNVAGLNLDEIVHFRHKEVIIYPDDDNKPPLGSGLNREAQVTLDQVYPHDKTAHEPITDPVRLAEMRWEDKLRRVCAKHDTRFVEYRPETGSWVFRVKHFSKYGVNDSDEDDDAPVDPKKAKMTADEAATKLKNAQVVGDGVEKMTMAALKQAQKISEDAARAMDPKTLGIGANNSYAMDESADYMLMDKTQFYQNNNLEYPSMFNQNRNSIAGITSPAATLAIKGGADPERLQAMKMSFFLNEDVDSNNTDLELHQHHIRSRMPVPSNHDMFALWKDIDAKQGGFSESSSQIDFGLPLLSPTPPSMSSAASVISLGQEAANADHANKAVASTKKDQIIKLPPFIINAKVAPIRSLAYVVPMVKSIALPLHGKWAADCGLYRSNLFKTGFGPQNILIVPTTGENFTQKFANENWSDVTSKIFTQRAADDFSPTLLQVVKISTLDRYENFSDSITSHLEIQLRNSLQEDVPDSECPWIKPNCGTDLIVKHLNEAVNLINLGSLEEYAASVWALMLVLWGDHEELEGHDFHSHFVTMYRRDNLSKWLENMVTDKDLLTRTVSSNTYLSHLLELIMCHKVTQSCDLAFDNEDTNLALMLAQLSSGSTVRQLMEDQLAFWHKNKTDIFIDQERLKCFMLVAGVSMMDSSHGFINILDGLNWIKALAAQVWYFSSPTASISDALLKYDELFKSEEFLALPPLPDYTETTDKRSQHTNYDLRYHLLQLYSKRSHSMESVLNPATHTNDIMDYRLSWLILETLQALGYSHCSELCESKLHVDFALQLENNGLWQWAVFVLLHIKERNHRERAVQQMLLRYVSVSKDVALSENEKFVINNLGVPEKWIDYAKSVKAGAIGDHHLQAKYLLRAKQWAMAHDVIFMHIAPDAVINDNLDYLHELLTQFEVADMDKNIKVPNWSTQGQIFLDFIDINEKFKGLRSLTSETDIETRWENLKPHLAELCSRINQLPCPTPKHRLCQSEIAQSLACLVRGIILVCPNLNPCLVIRMAIDRLPLPQEFAKQELRALLDSLVVDLAKTNIESNAQIAMEC